MHDDVDPAEAIVDSLRDDSAAFRRGYICCDELVDMDHILRLRSRCGEDCGAGFAQGRNDSLADTFGAARDERAFSFEFQVMAHQ